MLAAGNIAVFFADNVVALVWDFLFLQTIAEGFAAAIDVGHDMVRNGLTQKIENDLKKYHARHPSPAGPEAA